jgi:hypothetical protein
MKIANMAAVADATMPDCWIKHDHGTHTPLPLDVSAVPDAVVERVTHAVRLAERDYYNALIRREILPTESGRKARIARAAIAALAQALGEVADE